MENKIKELIQSISDIEETLKDASVTSDASLVVLFNEELEKAKKELAELQSSASVAVDEAEKKVDEAETKKEKEEAKEELKEASKAKKDIKKVAEKVEKIEVKADVVEKKIKDKRGGKRPNAGLKEASKAKKDIKKVAEKVEKIEVKADVVEKKIKDKRGGKRPNAGRKASSIPKMPKEKKERGGKRLNAGRKKGSSPTKIVKPKNYVAGKDAPVFVKRAIVKKGKKAVPAKVEKVKKVRAFGQVVEYKNNSEFCSQLLKAFKKRKSVSKKLGNKKTRPVFGIITTKIKDAVTKAIDNTPKKDIEANPKAFLAKAERLEKSAIRFLEDFKAILGSDFKKSEITSEFGDLEKSIKQMISKYKK
jgi:hypothetical protein